MNDPARRTDRELYTAVATGSAQAFAELAGRHARGIYDFALRGTLDEQQAATVVEAVFRQVREPNADVPSQIDLRTWLYSLCLVEVLAVSNEARTARISPDDERFFQRTYAVDVEIASFAWQAARGLQTRDYCVLDLTLRRGLTPEEVAEAAALTRSNLYASIGRARGAFEEGYAAMLLFEHGRAACAVLDEMIELAPGNNLRPALRHQIIEHADTCDACRRTLDALPPAAEVYVSLADIELPDAVVRRILGQAARPEAAAAPAVAVAPEITAAAAARIASALAAENDDDEETDLAGEDATVGEDDVPEVERAEDDLADETAGDESDTLEAPVTRRFAAFGRQPPAPAASGRYTEGRGDEYAGSGGGGIAGWIGRARGQPIVMTYALLGIAAVLAIYLGIAVADSLQSGGRDSGAVPLDTAPGATGGRQLDCGPALEMDAGTPMTVSFDPDALAGYRISNLSYVPVSAFAAFEDLDVTLEDTHSIRFVARAQDTAERRTEEYELRVQWERNGSRAHSVCRLLVHVS